MDLPDFLEFEPFNNLRSKMGTKELGNFEFFDPSLHLTGEERSRLSRQGIEVSKKSVRLLSDHSLAYKNSRVVVLHDNKIHLSNCNTFNSEKLLIATHSRAVADASVCHQCLHALRYKGFDAFKARKAAYSQEVSENFNLEQFFEEYPRYPVDSQDMTLHFL